METQSDEDVLPTEPVAVAPVTQPSAVASFRARVYYAEAEDLLTRCFEYLDSGGHANAQLWGLFDTFLDDELTSAEAECRGNMMHLAVACMEDRDRRDRWTALFKRVMSSRHTNVADLCAEADADGNTPLDLAQSAETLCRLLDAGATPATSPGCALKWAERVWPTVFANMLRLLAWRGHACPRGPEVADVVVKNLTGRTATAGDQWMDPLRELVRQGIAPPSRLDQLPIKSSFDTRIDESRLEARRLNTLHTVACKRTDARRVLRNGMRRRRLRKQAEAVVETWLRPGGRLATAAIERGQQAAACETA